MICMSHIPQKEAEVTLLAVYNFCYNVSDSFREYTFWNMKYSKNDIAKIVI